MGEDDIPQEVKAFIADHVDSVLELEIVLLLRSRAGERWTAESVSREFRIDASWTAGQLAKLAASGILARGDESAGPAAGLAYRYAPQSDALDRAIAATDDAYNTRRVTIIGLIHSKPPSSLRSFADAFRLRKDKTDG